MYGAPAALLSISAPASTTALGAARSTFAKLATPALTTPALSYPLYSSYYTGSTPFHVSEAALVNAGGTILPSIFATNFWSQGVGLNEPYGVSSGLSPLYFVNSGDPSYTFRCPEFNGCPAAGKVVHYPSTALPAPGSDHHLISFDTVYANGETDGWGGYYGVAPGCQQVDNPQATPACPHPCNLTPGNPGTANCAFGGFSSFTGSGLGSGGNAAGYSYGLFEISAQDLLQGHIDHALGMVASCLDNGGVFPAPSRATDTACGPLHIAEPNPSYGHMIHLKSNVLVALYGYSAYCAIVVQALQTYGAYTFDTNGGYGIGLGFEVPANPMYGTNNPWTAIYKSMADGGDGQYNGPSGSFTGESCLQRIPASDIEIVQIPNTLPNAGPIGFLPI